MEWWKFSFAVIFTFALAKGLDAGFTTQLPMYGLNSRATKISDLSNVIQESLKALKMNGDFLQPFVMSGQAPVFKVSVGTPVQNFLARLDLFSSEFLIVDEECASAACIAFKRHLFNKKLSSTFQQFDNETLGHYYFANVVEDVVQIGSVSTKLRFPLAFELQKNFEKIYYHAVIGVAGPSLANTDPRLNVPSPLQGFDGSFDENVFVISYDKTKTDRIVDDYWSRVGEVTFGTKVVPNCGPDWKFVPTKIDNNLADARQFMINGFSVGTSLDNRRKRDTWFSNLFPYTLAPQRNVESIATALGAKLNTAFNVYTVNCNDVNTLPEITLKLEGFTISIPAVDYIDNSDEIQSELGKDICLLTIIPVPTTFWQIGTHFMKSNCVAFDYGNNKIGFAKKV